MIFQCLKGRRGESACEIFKPQSPATPLYNIAGGITAWKEAGLPVITAGGVGNAGASCGCGVPIFRQVQMVVGLVIAAFVALGYMGFTIGFALAGLALRKRRNIMATAWLPQSAAPNNRFPSTRRPRAET